MLIKFLSRKLGAFVGANVMISQVSGLDPLHQAAAHVAALVAYLAAQAPIDARGAANIRGAIAALTARVAQAARK